MILVAIFFVSGADSASLVMGTLSERGAHEPSRSVTIFWGVLTGAVAALLLAMSGDDGLSGIKQMAIIAALPFVVVMIGMCLSLYLDLRRDPSIVARSQLDDQVDQHIRAQAEKIGTGEIVVVDPVTLERPPRTRRRIRRRIDTTIDITVAADGAPVGAADGDPRP